MKKTMVYLDDELYQALRRVAHLQTTSIAKLIRKAVRLLLREGEIYDLTELDRRMAHYLGHRSSSVEARDAFKRIEGHRERRAA